MCMFGYKRTGFLENFYTWVFYVYELSRVLFLEAEIFIRYKAYFSVVVESLTFGLSD